MDDLLSCSIRTWNVRLCEWLMREVIVGTVLFQWNRSIMTLEMNHKHGVASNSSGLKNPDVYKVAEVRSSMWFITQVFGMVEYTPLIRMVATVVLHEMHPKSWCGPDGDNTGDAVGSGLNFSNNLHAYSGSEGFFIVTPTLNAMVTGKKCSDSRIGEKASSALSNGEEADAGAGGGVPTPSPSSDSIPSESSESDDVGQCPKSDKNNSGDVDEMEDHVLEATAAELSVRERKDDDYSSMRDNSSATTTVTVEEEKLISNPYRASLLNMLAGDSALEDTVLASMLFATILENEAIDDDALEALGVFMDEGSPFEKSLAHYLQRDLATIHSSDIYAPSYATLASAVECISSLGLMFLERIVFRRFASSKIEDLHDIDQDPFDQYCKSSEWIRALGGALSYFALYARRLSQSETVSDLFAEFMESAIGQRYSNEPERSQQSVHHIDDEESNINLVCSLHKYFPSNFIDNSNMLINDVMGSNSLGGSTGKSFQNETEASKFAIRLTLHLVSLRCT